MNYSVKSGYWLSNHLPEFEANAIEPPPGSPTLKEKIWKATIPSKLKQFLWRVLSSALSTGTEFNHRGIPLDPTCAWCSDDDKSSNHLFQCFAKSVWRLSKLQLQCLQNPLVLLQDNIHSLLSVYGSAVEV